MSVKSLKTTFEDVSFNIVAGCKPVTIPPMSALIRIFPRLHYYYILFTPTTLYLLTKHFQYLSKNVTMKIQSNIPDVVLVFSLFILTKLTTFTSIFNANFQKVFVTWNIIQEQLFLASVSHRLLPNGHF